MQALSTLESLQVTSLNMLISSLVREAFCNRNKERLLCVCQPNVVSKLLVLYVSLLYALLNNMRVNLGCRHKCAQTCMHTAFVCVKLWRGFGKCTPAMIALAFLVTIWLVPIAPVIPIA